MAAADALAEAVRGREVAAWRAQLDAGAAAAEQRAASIRASDAAALRDRLRDACAAHSDDALACLRPRWAQLRAGACALATVHAEVAALEALGGRSPLPALQALRAARGARDRKRRQLRCVMRALEGAWDALPPGARTAAWWALDAAAVPATWSGCLRWQGTARVAALVRRLEGVAAVAAADAAPATHRASGGGGGSGGGSGRAAHS